MNILQSTSKTVDRHHCIKDQLGDEEARVKSNYEFIKGKVTAEINRYQNKDPRLKLEEAPQKNPGINGYQC